MRSIGKCSAAQLCKERQKLTMKSPLFFSVLVVTGCFFQLQYCICFEGISDEGLVGYWPLDEGEGTIAKDESGNGNDGQIEGVAEWVTGIWISGGALELKAENKAKVKILNNPSICATNAITLCAWIKLFSIYEGDNWKLGNTVMGKRVAYYLIIGAGRNPQSLFYGTIPKNTWLVGKTDLKRYIGKWVHVACVYDGSKHVLYVNGNRDASREETGDIQVSTENLYLGWVDTERYIDGVIDEAMLWTRALSRAEILSLISTQQAVLSPEGKLAITWAGIKLQL